MQMEVTKRKATGVLAKMVENMDEESLAKTREEMMEQHPIVYTREMGLEALRKIEYDRVFGDPARLEWKNLASGSNHIGNCSEMSQLICGAFKENNEGRLPTDQEYLDIMIDYAESQKGRLKVDSRGPTTTEWWRIGEILRNGIKKAEPTFTYSAEDCLYAALYHTVTQTMDGKRAEKEFVDKLISRITKKDVEYPSGSDDAYFGVDFFAYFGKDCDRYGIQVKPISFFKRAHIGKSRKDVENDTELDSKNLVEKYFSAMKNCNIVGMLYAIYETRGDNDNEWYYKEVNGRKKFLFTIDELYDVEKKEVNCFVCGRMKYKKCPINIS